MEPYGKIAARLNNRKSRDGHIHEVPSYVAESLSEHLRSAEESDSRFDLALSAFSFATMLHGYKACRYLRLSAKTCTVVEIDPVLVFKHRRCAWASWPDISSASTSRRGVTRTNPGMGSNSIQIQFLGTSTSG